MTTGKKSRIDFVIGHFVVVTMPGRVCSSILEEMGAVDDLSLAQRVAQMSWGELNSQGAGGGEEVMGWGWVS